MMARLLVMQEEMGHVDPLLGNNREINNYTKAAAR
jgi:hypothetical protein